MTVEEVRARVEQIRATAEADDEQAHIDQDALYADVLVAIAEDKTHAQELAKTALKVREIRFYRWYA